MRSADLIQLMVVRMTAGTRRDLFAQRISVPVTLRRLDPSLAYHLVLLFHLDVHRNYHLVLVVHLEKTY